MANKLTIEDKGNIFRLLASKSLYEAGVEYGLEKNYKTTTNLKSAVYNIYREVSVEPERFAIHPDTRDLVVKNVSGRKVQSSKPTTLAEDKEKAAKMDIKDIIMSNRDSAARLINKKLVALEKSPKALKNESIVSLGKIFGILFDKSQIIQGQATEHVALMGKIDSNLPPEDAINLVLRMRENAVNKSDE
jgi:hypothetical protein